MFTPCINYMYIVQLMCIFLVLFHTIQVHYFGFIWLSLAFFFSLSSCSFFILHSFPWIWLKEKEHVKMEEMQQMKEMQHVKDLYASNSASSFSLCCSSYNSFICSTWEQKKIVFFFSCFTSSMRSRKFGNRRTFLRLIKITLKIYPWINALQYSLIKSYIQCQASKRLFQDF